MTAYDLVIHAARAILPARRDISCTVGSSPTARIVGDRTTSAQTSAADQVLTARRRRGAAARPGRHPRARQRSRPHRVGGLRQRHPGGRRRRRHDHHRHAAEQPAADRRRRCARRETQSSAGQLLRRRRILGRRDPRQRVGSAAAARRRACSASSASWPIPASRSSRGWNPTEFVAALREVADLRRADDRARRGRARPRAHPGRRRAAATTASSPPDRAGVENLAIAEVIEAARWTGCRLHILHLSVRGRAADDPLRPARRPAR